MTHVYRRELERALEEMGYAVRGWEMEDSPAAGARARVRTLEGKAVEIECVNDGFLIISTDTPDDDKRARPRVYDTLDSLLINASPGAMRAVNERLAERLRAVAEGREGRRW
ncbi:26S proteasome regulatory subunit 7 [Naganishia albida]|nr:26S proteasome regulatory subunit 7 [Naganishia albida]